jgi:hypothetical protein
MCNFTDITLPLLCERCIRRVTLLWMLVTIIKHLPGLQDPLFINQPLPPFLALIIASMRGVSFIVLHATIRTHVSGEFRHMHAIL